MVLETTHSPAIFTEVSAYSLAAVAMIGYTASTAANAFLPKNARWQDRTTFVWLVSPTKPSRQVQLFMLLILYIGIRRNDPFLLRRFFLVPFYFWTNGQLLDWCICRALYDTLCIFCVPTSCLIISPSRERICTGRLSVGFGRLHCCIPGDFDGPWSWPSVLSYSVSND